MRTVFCCVLLLALFACDEDEPCDEGEKHVQGACVPDEGSGNAGDGDDDDKGDSGPSGSSGKGGSSGASGKGGASGGGTNDAGMTEQDAGGSAECSEDRDAILGEDCTTDDDCNCAAPYCAKMPGAAMGFCTVFCNPDPDDCPDAYMCFDLSKLGVEGYEPFCVME